MKRIFYLTNKYIVLTTPLVLFALLSGIYLIFAGGAARISNMLLIMTVLVAMTAAFIAGWCNMLKKSVLDEFGDDSYRAILAFVPGVGEYFIPVIGAIFIWIVLSVVLMVLAFAAGNHFIGNPNVPLQELSSSMANNEVLMGYLKTLSHSQLVKLELWNMLILGTIVLSHFFVLLLLPVMYFVEKNPFKAFWITLKDTFSKKIIKTIGIYFAILCLNFALSIFSGISGSNAILGFIALMLNFYFVCFVSLWVFDYYHSEFALNKS